MKNEPPRKRYSADSWVKLMLMGALALSLTLVTVAGVIRVIRLGEKLDSSIMLELFNSYIGLFGVVIGYVLGSKRD